MSEASKMNVRVSLGNDTRRNFKKPTTLQNMVYWIDSLEYNEKIKSLLVKKVSSYPANTYQKFVKDLNVHVASAIKIINEEGGDF